LCAKREILRAGNSYNDFMASNFDVCIRGSGMVGSSLALLLARQRLRVALVGSPQPAHDVRAFALNESAHQLLSDLRCWPNPQHATPVQTMQVWGDAGGQLQFQSPSLQGLTHIVDVPVLEDVLREAVDFQHTIERVSEPVLAKLTVVCEGRNSQSRQELGVAFNTLPYQQQALATRVQCAQAHRQQALQWFSQSNGELEILALLPLGGPQGREAAVVWSLPPTKAQAMQLLEPHALAQALGDASHLALGALEVTAPAQTWPLQLAMAEQWSGRNAQGAWVLAGDAAHTIHPLAGLGLNLGLGDVRELAAVLQTRETTDYWRGLDDVHLLRRYERARKADMQGVWLACDGLQRLFNHPNTLVQHVRNWGMNSFNQLSPLKQWTVQQAMH
jgi:2-polyprenyl-6-methoxyphenol hydroxylase-like FAD-dependent oxidoreductase